MNYGLCIEYILLTTGKNLRLEISLTASGMKGLQGMHSGIN